MSEQCQHGWDRCRYKDENGNPKCPYRKFEVCRYVCEEDIYVIREKDGLPEIRVLQHETYRADDNEKAKGKLVEYFKKVTDWRAYFVTPNGFRFLFSLGPTVTKVTQWFLDFTIPRNSPEPSKTTQTEGLEPGYLLNLSVLRLATPNNDFTIDEDAEDIILNSDQMSNLGKVSEREYDGDIPEEDIYQLRESLPHENLYVVSWDDLPAQADWNNPLMMHIGNRKTAPYAVSYISEEELDKCPLLEEYVINAGEDSLIEKSKEVLQTYFYETGVQVGAASTTFIGSSNLHVMGICYVVNLTAFKQ